MFGKCFRSAESLRGINTAWRRDWSFPPQPGRDRSKRSFIHLIRCALIGAFLSILASVSVAQDPATVGQFSSVMTWPYEAIHAHLLPTRKVIFWTRGDHSQLWDPATNTVTAAAASGANIFCSGHAF